MKTGSPEIAATPFTTISGRPINELYTADDLQGWDYEQALADPGAFPYTRGIHASGYRGKLWTMRQFAGFGTPEETNERYKHLLEAGGTGLSVAFNPYMLGAHAEELLRKRIMISPVVVVWRYAVPDDESFADWLSTREILLSESRMAGDPELKGVRYGGTYRMAGGDSSASRYNTIWGYTSEAAMNAMHRLCSDDCASASLVQLELIDFVKGLEKFVAQAGEQHFTQETLISASAGRV